MTKKQWDDQSAVEDIRAGKQEGTTYLYNKYERLLRSFCKNKCGVSNEQAEEVVQETFIRFIKHIRKNKPPENVRGFLFIIGRNECYRLCSKKLDNPSQPSGEGLNNIPSDINIEEQILLLDCLSKALKEFEKQEKNAKKCLKILTLVAEGWSLGEIAEKINKTYGATRESLSQCRKKLRPYLQPCRDK